MNEKCGISRQHFETTHRNYMYVQCFHLSVGPILLQDCSQILLKKKKKTGKVGIEWNCMQPSSTGRGIKANPHLGTALCAQSQK